MKNLVTLVLVVLAVIGLFLILRKDKPQVRQNQSINYTKAPAQNVSIVDGIQIIEIRARGGYSPRQSVAKAGLLTVIRFDSKGTFDCSASVRIPSLRISQSLDFSGSTDIDIGTPKVGLMKGSCSMGMYPFEIDFQS